VWFYGVCAVLFVWVVVGGSVRAYSGVHLSGAVRAYSTVGVSGAVRV